MKQDILRSLIKEELAKKLNENQPKFKEGDKFNFRGMKHVVLSDDGFSIKAKLESGKIKTYNYNQLKDSVTETIVTARADRDGRMYLRSIANLIKKYPDLDLEDVAFKFMEGKGVEDLGQLSVEDIMNLNIIFQKEISKNKPQTKDTDLGGKGEFLDRERSLGRSSGLD